MNRYQVLLRVLDQLRTEAPPNFKTYHPADDEIELVNAARSLAYIHLLLKVRFGLIEFLQRDIFLTDGASDGGIDAYYIDCENRTISFIQSKFRNTERNFEEKSINAEELLAMDIDRILSGETTSENGIPYNSKIQTMMKRVRTIEDIGRYQYRVIILANARGVTRQKLTQLTGGISAELIDHARCYRELLFPLVSGTFFTADCLHLSLTLSNKNAGAKISYSVQTEHAKTEITVVFVPTIEIAKAMFKYRNAILKYNPRSYLEHEGQSVNREIRRSIESRLTNEFALFNNGITVLSDETYLNERIGQKDRAQLSLVNPQIINGGQTAYTLSQIYKENIDGDAENIFGQKEVLVKIITFDGGNQLSESQKLALIEDISRATNSQTAVTNADRRSNEFELQELQRRAFERLGVFLERKRGEFGDGVREGYLPHNAIAERNIFLRASLVVHGRLKEAASKKLAAKCNYKSLLEVPDSTFDDYGLALLVLQRIHEGRGKRPVELRFRSAAMAYVGLLVVKLRYSERTTDAASITAVAVEVMDRWSDFVAFCRDRHALTFARTKKGQSLFAIERYIKSEYVSDDVKYFFASESSLAAPLAPESS